MNMIRKGQVRSLAKGDIVGQMSFIQRLFGISAMIQTDFTDFVRPGATFCNTPICA